MPRVLHTIDIWQLYGRVFSHTEIEALRSFLAGGAAVAFLLVAAPALADPLGLWRDSDGTTIRVQRCGGAMCGTIVSMTPPNDPETGQPWTDKHNPEQTKRGDPLIGRQENRHSRLCHSLPENAKVPACQLLMLPRGSSL